MYGENPSSVENLANDAELVRRARSGSVAALGELYRRYGAMVYATALRLLASPADAEDVMQDVFLGLPTALQRYEERGVLPAWLRRIAARHALLAMRRTRVEGHARQRASEAVAATPDPSRGLDARNAVACLPDSLRVVFVLKEIEGYSHADIAELLGITARASALRLHRAWKIVRQRTGEA